MNAQPQIIISGEAADPASPLAPSIPDRIVEGERPEPGVPAPAPSHPRPMLTPQERDERRECERIIGDGLQKGLEASAALSIMDGKRLYRDTHDTFALYIEDVWGMKVRQAYRLMAHHETLRAINGIDPNRNDPDRFMITAPESHTRPFYSLPLETRGMAWQEALATAPKGVLTGKHATRVANEWKVRLGLASGLAPVERPVEQPETASPARPPRVRREQIGPIVDTTVKTVRLLVDVIGTPDSSEAAEVSLALELIEKYRDHLDKMERMHSGRAA